MIGKWPRYCELLLAAWLVVSGWIVQHPEPLRYQLITIAAALAVVILDVLSITLYRRYAHLLILLLAAALVGVGFFDAAPASQGVQNLIVVGLLLAMFAILPTEALLPPPSWRDFNRRS